ncbi:hypothetical protein [Nostoc sp. NMS4]|uniref:hypothetical protein n=1 Tax=Nostoc sp. NMS4 TaxID=2815390 RepID=UPI0025F15101|nr:hypothetical protein [Nostoc sp. NMS4]MBN3925630.1 hypothetical protein [Nostoc sp. NMS4]
MTTAFAPETQEINASAKSKNLTLIYSPELARAMKELNVCHPAEACILINQLAFWMQSGYGYRTEDDRKWIYNSYEDWTSNQFTSLSPWNFGKMARELEALGIIEKDCYVRLKKHLVTKPPHWHPDLTSSWMTLDVERLFELTGCFPHCYGKSPNPLLDAEIANAMTRDCDRNDAKLQTQFPSTYKENSISTQDREIEKERVLDKNQENQELDQWLDFDPWSDEPPINTHYVGSLEQKPLNDHTDSSEGECSAAPPPSFEKLVTEPKCDSVAGVGFKKKSDSSPEVKDQAQQVWEIAPKRPFPVFLHWWADKKYKPQGGKWEAAAISNAYSEFYKDCDRTTVAIFPEFLEYMQRVAQNCNQQVASGIKAILPSCFVAMPEANHQNVRQVMVNIQELVDKGAQVALPTNSVTPACTQSMSFDAAANAGIIQPLQEFIAIAPTPEPEVSPDEELLRILQIKQTSWRNAPALRDGIKRWVEKTLGVVMGDNGPELQL